MNHFYLKYQWNHAIVNQPKNKGIGKRDVFIFLFHYFIIGLSMPPLFKIRLNQKYTPTDWIAQAY